MIDWRRAWNATWITLLCIVLVIAVGAALYGFFLLLEWSTLFVFGLAILAIVVYFWIQLYRSA